MSTNATGARLSIEIDTTDLNRAERAAQAATQQFSTLARAADASTAALGRTGKASQTLERSFEEIVKNSLEGIREMQKFEREVTQLAREISKTTDTIDQMAAKVANLTAKTGTVAEYVEHYTKALKALRGAQDDYNKVADKGITQTTALVGAIGGLAGALGYSLVQSVSAALGVLARLPVDMAYAADRVTTLNAKLAFSFRGNVESARVAQRDLARIAMESGANYQDLARNYGEIAVASRGVGLTRRDVTDITESFNYMGQMAGTSPADISRGMWQFQQALSIGRLNYQDARLMFQAIPAMDTVMAAGAGVTPGRLQSMISGGEIDAEKMVKYLIEGIRIMKQEGHALPETLERAQNRIASQWELLLQTMGQKLNASPVLQAWSNLIAQMIEETRLRIDPSSDPKRALQIARGTPDWLWEAKEGLVSIPRVRMGGPKYVSRASVIRDAQNQIYREGAIEAEADLRDEETAERDRNANVLESARQSRMIVVRRQQTKQDIEKAERALASRYFDNDADKQLVRLHIEGLKTQLSLIEGTFARIARTGMEAAADARFGSAGGAIMARAREASRASLQDGPGEFVSVNGAFAELLSQDLTGRRGALAAQSAETAARRRFARPGGDAAAQIDAQASIEAAALATQFGELATTNKELAAVIDLTRQTRADALRQQNDQAAEERLAAGGYDLRVARARARFAGDPRMLRDALRELEIERDTAGVRDPARAQLLRGQRSDLDAANDEAALAGVRQGSADRIRVAENLSKIEARNSREYAIQKRIVEEIERARVNATGESEKEIANRVRSEAEADRALEKRDRAMRRLQTIGERTASAIGDAFDTALQDAFQKGRISLENLGKIVQSLALDISSQIIRKAIADPLADAASSGIQGFFSSLFKRSALGNAFVDGRVQPYAAGGVISRPTLFPFAGGMGLAGEAGSEAILPLRRGTDGRLGVAASGGGWGGDGPIIINDMRGSQAEPVDVQTTRGQDGKRLVEITVRDTVRAGFSQGHFDGAMRQRYGQGRMIKQV